jgi:hypothetical protein
MRLDRRTVLKGLLGGAVVSVALPALEIMLNEHGTALADGSAFPTRFGLWVWGNGVTPSRWVPALAGEGEAWQLSEQLSPLAAVKSKLIVPSGFEVRARNLIPHLSGFGALLTGLAQIGEEGDNTYAGPTIDQQIAAVLGADTAYRSIEAGGWFSESISHNGPHSPNPPETVPHVLFERLFGPTFRAPGEETRVDPRLALRRSVLDAVGGRVTSLQAQLGSADRARLDQHLSGIRDLELRLARLEAGPPDLAACMRPDAPTSAERLADAFLNHEAIADLMVMALACDQTRVMTLSFMHGVSNYLFPGATAGHHELTHNEPPDDLGYQPEVHRNTMMSIEQLGYLLRAMDAVTEGDGTLLDHSAVLATTDVSWGFTHQIDEYPIVIAGSANGRFKQDVHYRSTTRENPSRVMLSLIRAMGIVQASYGDEDRYTEDGLGAIEA